MSRTSSDGGEKPSESAIPPDAKAEPLSSKAETMEYPSGRKRVLIMMAIYLAMFLVALDQNIISTAIPRITDEFDSLDNVGWYGTAYLLTMCSFQLVMGKVYKFYHAKPIFLACCALFEVGSAICGAAPNSTALIFGRAIAGLGASGIFGGIMVILFHTVPLQQRPMYTGVFGAIFALASVIGPLIGGSFTEKVTWRWCFYINIPVGAVSIITTLLVLKLRDQKVDAPADGFVAKIQQLDPIGNLAFFPGIICLILALQWGGTEYSWSDARIIVLFVLCGVCCVAFVGIQIWKKEDATVPPRIVKQRSMAAALWFGFFNGATSMVMLYYLPLWFQAIKGVSAIQSGIMLLPVIITTVVGSIIGGVIISKVGYYAPFFLLSSIIMPIGVGLMTTFTPDTSTAKWIGYQIVFGIGLSFGAQQPLNVVQTVLERSDIPTGSAVVAFSRFLGPAIFLSVAQTVFLNGLISKVGNISGIDPSAIIGTGATSLRDLASGDELATLLTDYNAAIVGVFYMVVATGAVTIFGSVFVEWRSLKARAKEQAGNKADPTNLKATDEETKSGETV